MDGGADIAFNLAVESSKNNSVIAWQGFKNDTVASFYYNGDFIDTESRYDFDTLSIQRLINKLKTAKETYTMPLIKENPDTNC